MSALTEIIKQFSGQYNTITLQRPYIKFTGSPEGGLLLSQMIYWADRTKDPDGWFYKTYPEWEEEIGVKKKAVSKFASAWVCDGFLETDVRKNPQGTPVVHYRFSIDLFAEKLTSFLESANPPDRKFQDRVSNKSTRLKVLNDSIESANPPGREFQSARTTLYTSNTSSNTSSTNTSPERGHEEVFDGEVISGELVSESEPTRSDFVVQQPKDSSLTQDDRREDQIAAAPKISPEPPKRHGKPLESTDAHIASIGYSLVGSGGDSTGASRSISIGWPSGPWVSADGGINGNLVRWVADSWRSGSSPRAKDFAAQQLEQVEASVKRYWAKNFVNLALDWEAYTANSERLAQSTELRVSGGVEIPLTEQEAIVSRLQSAGIIPGSRVVPVGNLRSFSEPFLLTLSVEEQQQQKLAINAARSKFFSAPVNSLMEAC